MAYIKDGSHHAFSELYDRYAPRLKAFFFRMLWSQESLSEDFVQDLFERLIERPHLFQDGRKFQPWLFQIAANMCKNHYRRQAFEKDYLNQVLPEPVVPPVVENHIQEAQLKDQIEEKLNEMDEEHRTIFLLHYQQEIPLEELAKFYDLPMGTIKSRLFHIRKKITKSISN